MGAKIRRKRKDIPAGRPSTFFIIALILGIALLVWVAFQVVTRPATPPKRHTDASPLSRSARSSAPPFAGLPES